MMSALRPASRVASRGLILRICIGHCRYGQDLRRDDARTFGFIISARAYSRGPFFPTIPACPESTCLCAATPPGLDIDRTLPLNGSMVPHAEHVLISTGREDWASRIEDGQETDSPGVGLVKGLKALLGRRGAFANPFHNIMISNSSFAPDVANAQATASALLLPSFLRVSQIPYDQTAVINFLKGYLLPLQLHSSYTTVPEADKRRLTRNSSKQAAFQSSVTDVREFVILICSHGNRDERCGIMGPLLRDEFLAQLRNAGLLSSSQFAEPGATGSVDAVVGLVSHVGGHKFAGNVIIYVPPDKPGNALAGNGIWYGRVEPKHVEGIIHETIRKGIIIQDLFRGGVGPHGEMLRL